MFISENGYEGSDEDYLTPSPSDSAVGDLESIVKVLGETTMMSNCSCLIFLQSYIATESIAIWEPTVLSSLFLTGSFKCVG
jgi:hypothetical protein